MNAAPAPDAVQSDGVIVLQGLHSPLQCNYSLSFLPQQLSYIITLIMVGGHLYREYDYLFVI